MPDTNQLIERLIDLKKKKKREKVFKRLSRLPVASLNYHLGNYKDVAWLIGSGRSGTTWLSSLINWNGRYRELYEPVHPGHVRQTQDFGFHPYIRCNDNTSQVSKFLYSVFSGRFKHFRADVSKPRLFHQGLLIKEIFANLLAGWVHQNIPHAKKIMLVRNPFAVALSKQKYKHWIWMTDPKQFLEQSSLMHDYLSPFEHLIKRSKDDFIENQVLIWAIIHYVPFRQLNEGDVYVLFYENLFCNPEEELLKLFNYLYGNELAILDTGLLSQIRKPSRSRGKRFSTLSAQSPLDVWKSELSPKQIDNGLKILEEFGLQDVYASNSTPQKKSTEILFGTR